MNPLAISSTNAGRRSELMAPCMFYPIYFFLSYNFSYFYPFMARDGAPNNQRNFNVHLFFFFYNIIKTAKASGRTLLPSGRLFTPPGDPCSASTSALQTNLLY